MLRNSALLLLAACVAAHAERTYPTAEETATFFRRFRAQPREVMHEPLAHHKQSGGDELPPFSAQQVQSGAFVEAKLQQREKLMAQEAPGRRAGTVLAEQTRDARNLVDNFRNVVTRVAELEAEAGNAYTLPVQAWSASYWPLYQGALAHRYADDIRHRSFYAAYNWSRDSRPAVNYTLANRHNLSPAEKYDLIVGDAAWSLTNFAWNEGKAYADNDENGDVETWMGLCHGWAPAAYMLPRPTRPINVKDPNGDDLLLYPSDVKALGTMLWAKVPFETRFLGGRCNVKDVEEDENGRILDSTCFDVNPGTWHISVMNQLGISHRSLILDVTYDYQVWNQPLLGYRVQYVNPQTFGVFDNSASATIPIGDFTSDTFKKYRSSAATHIVGVSMSIDYVLEVHASQTIRNSEADDAVHTVTYRYDLELDAEGEILGGEWYQTRHPDFLWTPTPGALPSSQYTFADRHAGFPDWNEDEPMPARWALYARYTAAYGYLQTKVVGELFKRASVPLPHTAAPATPAPPTQAPPPPAAYYPFECRGATEELAQDEDELAYPGDGAQYPHNDDRCWRVSCNNTVAGAWTVLDTEANYDFVSVFSYNNNTDAWDRVFHRSGHFSDGLPATVAPGPVVVRFTSDYSETALGFNLTLECITQ